MSFEILFCENRDESEGASELAYTPTPTSRDSRLNIQNQRLSRSVTSFEEAYVFNLHLPFTPIPHKCTLLLPSVVSLI